MTRLPTTKLLHSTPMNLGNVEMPWPISDGDLKHIKEQIRRNPARVWPAQLAMEWDITEGVARKLIREVKNGA